jgi:hypothetical protein
MFEIWETYYVMQDITKFRCLVNGRWVNTGDTLPQAIAFCPKGMTIETHLFSGDWGSELLSDTVNGHWWDTTKAWHKHE